MEAKAFDDLEVAVYHAAKQNFLRDAKVRLVSLHDWKRQDVQQVYFDEARHLLVTTGENYLPEREGDPHIVLSTPR